jgi:hypothetical protein
MSGRATTSGLGLSLNSDTDGVSTSRRSMGWACPTTGPAGGKLEATSMGRHPSPSAQLAPSFAPFSTPTFSDVPLASLAFRIAGEQGPPRNSIWPRHEGGPLL